MRYSIVCRSNKQTIGNPVLLACVCSVLLLFGLGTSTLREGAVPDGEGHARPLQGGEKTCTIPAHRASAPAPPRPPPPLDALWAEGNGMHDMSTPPVQCLLPLKGQGQGKRFP